MVSCPGFVAADSSFVLIGLKYSAPTGVIALGAGKHFGEADVIEAHFYNTTGTTYANAFVQFWACFGTVE